jgi:hypothetical protein
MSHPAPGGFTLMFPHERVQCYIEPQYQICLECPLPGGCHQRSTRCPAGFGLDELAARLKRPRRVRRQAAERTEEHGES